MVADVDWAGLAAGAGLGRSARLLAGVLPARRTDGGRDTARDGGPATEGPEELRARLAAMPENDRRRTLVELVRAIAAGVLGHESRDRIEPGSALTDLGFDSLTAVELRNTLVARTGLRLPAGVVFDHPTLAALSGHLLELLAEELAGTGASAVAKLADLEKALAGMAPGDETRTRVMLRLQALLTGWRDETPAVRAGDGEVDGGGLETASDEEMFEMLSKRFGIS
jgi:acyl carrier protein